MEYEEKLENWVKIETLNAEMQPYMSSMDLDFGVGSTLYIYIYIDDILIDWENVKGTLRYSKQVSQPIELTCITYIQRRRNCCMRFNKWVKRVAQRLNHFTRTDRWCKRTII